MTYVADGMAIGTPIIVVIIWVFVMLLKDRTQMVKEQEKQEKQFTECVETYGHPSSPVNALYNQLPKPPEGWLWEIEVVDSVLKGERDQQINTWMDVVRVVRTKQWRDRYYEVKSLALELRLVGLTDGVVRSKVSHDLLWMTWCEGDWEADKRQLWSTYYERWLSTSCFIKPFITWAKDLKSTVEQESLRSGEFRIKA